MEKTYEGERKGEKAAHKKRAGGAAGGIGGNGRKQNCAGYAARNLPERVPVAILSWGKGVRDLLSGDRAEFGFPLAPAGSCAVFFQ